jgi:hypothetical protein
MPKTIPRVFMGFAACMIAAGCPLPSTSGAASAAASLVAWYPFNGDARDASGHGNDGVPSASTVLTTDRFGVADRAYAFNGTDSYIRIPSSASLSSLPSGITMSAWILISGWSLVGDPFGPILMKSESVDNDFEYRMGVASTGLFAHFGDWFTGETAPFSFDFDHWYMVTVTMDADSLRSFVDGAPIAVVPGGLPIVPDTRPLLIGCDWPGYFESFNGKIDEVRIYDGALTPEEVLDLYLSGAPASVGEAMEDGRGVTRLLPAFPNPTAGSAYVPFQLAAPAALGLTIFTVDGRLVRTLAAGERRAEGAGAVRWDGLDDAGRRVPNGVYYCRLSAAGTHTSRRLVVSH